MAQTANALPDQSANQPKLESAHAGLLADKSIQLDHADALIKDVEVPAWLEWVGEAIRFLSSLISVLFWVGVALLIGLLVYFLVTEVMGVKLFRARPASTLPLTAPDWRPDIKEARDLLAAADRLAADGHYGQAVHLILLRSIEHIDRFRPLTVRPALTARDIGAMSALPEHARPTFTRIAGAVERTLFAGMSIDRNEFSACREAYAAFALPQGWLS